MYSAYIFPQRVPPGASSCDFVREIPLWKLNKSFCVGQYGFDNDCQ